MRGQDVIDRAADLVTRTGGILTCRAARAAGLSPDAVESAARRGQLYRLRRGIYTTSMLWESAGVVGRHRLLLRAGQEAVPGSVAVADSAAVVLELPVPTVPERPRLVLPRGTVRSGGRAADGTTRGRRAFLPNDEVMMHDGLRVTSPARTVVDCARHLDLPWTLAVADAACRRWQTDGRVLAHAARRNPHAPGHPAARWAAHHARPEPESPLESLARAEVILDGHPAPEPQVWVMTDRRRYRVDLMDRLGVIIEADGRVKYTEPGDLWQEKLREDALRQRHEVLRFTMDDHRRPEPWRQRYRRAQARAAGSVPRMP